MKRALLATSLVLVPCFAACDKKEPPTEPTTVTSAQPTEKAAKPKLDKVPRTPDGLVGQA